MCICEVPGEPWPDPRRDETETLDCGLESSRSDKSIELFGASTCDGFATTQEADEEAIAAAFATLGSRRPKVAGARKHQPAHIFFPSGPNCLK